MPAYLPIAILRTAGTILDIAPDSRILVVDNWSFARVSSSSSLWKAWMSH
jgi:hypothetical protein